MSKSNSTALVTGANSGLGFEAALQLAESGYGRIILACRSEEKGLAARDELIKRTGKDVFEALAIDVSEVNSALAAAQQLVERSGKIELLILNAGVGSQALRRTSDGIELILATTLFGHHVLTMKLLEAGLLTTDAHIVIACSEAARGSVAMPGMSNMLYDYSALQAAAGGDLGAAMDALARGDETDFNFNDVYCNAKIWVAWWAARLATKLPEGMVVAAVSPGANPATNFARELSPIMQLMMKIMGVVGPLFKISGPLKVGAKRYVDAAQFGPEASGKFWGSPPKALVGPLEVQTEEHLYDQILQVAAWQSLVRLTGVDYPTSIIA